MSNLYRKFKALIPDAPLLVGTVVARNRGRARRKEQRAYQCPYCGSWHLTKTPVMRATGSTPNAAPKR